MSDDLKDRFPDLRPGERPGPLSGENGIGTALVGRRDFDPETGTYVKTHVFRVLFVPLWAIGAYRVADAPGGGWYCLGRVPLSAAARLGNLLLVLAVVGAGTGFWWNAHTKSPEYVAGQKLKRADEAAAAGHGGEAAQLAREVLDSQTSKTEDGRVRLAGYIEQPPGPPAEAAAVYRVAVDLHRESRCPVPDVFASGKALAEKYAPEEPGAALALLEVIAAFAPDPQAELNLRRDLLERLFAKSPDSPEVASRLAAVYEEKGERERCEKLLAPFEGRLGTLDGAAILGRILSGRGQLDKARALLAPFVEARLPALRAAEAEFKAAYQAAEGRAVELLKGGKAPGFDYSKYDRATKAQQQTMVSSYIDDQLKDDPGTRAARQKMMAERAVVGATIDLGLVQLQRGQAVSDPAKRKAELEAAERTFLSVRGFAGESAEYKLSLGQVYYWLGKPAEGKQLFDAVLASAKTTQNLLLVARALREVGDSTGARRRAEEAYAAESDPGLKFVAARSRSVLFTDVDDQILWLTRSDPESRDVQAALAAARGQRAEQDGNDAAAADHFRQALGIYAQIPEGAASLNNAALAHFALFRVTLDRDEFARGADKLDRAVALDPSSVISLLNASSMVAESAARDTVGKAVDFAALKGPSPWEVLPYLYRTPAERAATAKRLAAHPGYVKAKAYADKLLVLSPRRDDTYQILSLLFEHAEDVDGLKGLAARAAKADLDVGDDEQRYKDFLSGKDDAKKVEETKAHVARTAEALAAARRAGGATFAVAVGRYVRAKTGAWAQGQDAGADELVKLAEEAHALTPSAGSEATLQSALTFRAHLALIAADTKYAGMAAKSRRSFGTSLVVYAITVDGPHRAKVVASADVRRLAGLAEEGFRRDPGRAHASEWVLLSACGSPAAKPVGAAAKANPRGAARRELARATAPYSAATALDEYWHLLLADKLADAGKVMKALGAKGVPVP